ncbi:MAG TPA: cysteine--tRNA ligase [Candidatus Avacidaminococcus intestinavium]|uniref:Cysteine--tRNA ligase n=1 Tax=Candidatus Avacidaminococcus intestinavium TaxID=2840684 RepID=A0A9D1SKI0_9FIRM|nr:cysteine--tRNA ligase [Candidatus Avacidaminococcus intestinavium]
MSIKVYNTLSRQKEDFVPVKEGQAGIYVCGVTPYNHPHIGNARPFVTWDVIHRFLEHEGYAVTHVQNFTDVDDKIINTANKEGVTWAEISGRYIDAYFTALDELNVKRVDNYPRVSEHMNDIIAAIAKLIENGYAYVVDGDVYFRVEKFADYGKLSGRKLEDMLAGARVDIDTRKENPMDFALWKAVKPGEPSWSAPWGEGRPGWHIECSVMSMKYLGESFDFHGGGSDLIFPHHENEIAQSEGCTGHHPFVKYWLHNGFITVNEEKMSKSLGNFFLVSDILKHFSAETLRFFILSTHYRSPLDFSDERLREAERGLSRLATAKESLYALSKIPGVGPDAMSKALLDNIQKLREAFLVAMRDDFNTALAISHMFEFSHEINIYYKKITDEGQRPDGKLVNTMLNIFAEMSSIIGVLEETVKNEETTEESFAIDILIKLREEARKSKDYAFADKVRDSLLEKGIVLEDTPQGARWKKQ